MNEIVGFCRELAVDEPLAGTGRDAVRRWILLEDNEPWGGKVPRETSLPEPVKAWLKTRDAEPHTRIQLVRRPGPERPAKRRLFVVDAPAEAAGRRIVELEVDLDALPTIDLDAKLAAAEPASAPLWLVCTHGTRDRCCAKWGMALWEQMRQLAPDRVWQTSHLGGHRFAPIVLALPSGLMWGRLETTEAAQLHAGIAAGQVPLPAKLRGRCGHPQAVQAAESELRAREGIAADDAVRLVEHEALVDGSARVCFERPGGPVELRVESVLPRHSTPISCGEDEGPRPYFRVVSVR